MVCEMIVSDIYHSLKQDLIDVYRCKPSDLHIPMFGHAYKKVLEDGNDEEVMISSLLRVRMTYGQAVEMLLEVREKVIDTPEGFKVLMVRNFDRTKDNKPSWNDRLVGEIRIFSPSLLCFYTGRNWVKLDRVFE